MQIKGVRGDVIGEEIRKMEEAEACMMYTETNSLFSFFHVF